MMPKRANYSQKNLKQRKREKSKKRLDREKRLSKIITSVSLKTSATTLKPIIQISTSMKVDTPLSIQMSKMARI
jgi:hypothetical protein